MHESDLAVRHEAPYPPLIVTERNVKYARIIQSNTASAKSEMTAINQYVYQSWVLKPCYPEIAHSMLDIAKVEMHHLDMLSDLIVSLGGDPKFEVVKNNCVCIWNANMLNYSKDPATMMRGNIAAEQMAIDDYMRSAHLIQNENIAAVLYRIIQDEQVHIGLFKLFLAQFCG